MELEVDASVAWSNTTHIGIHQPIQTQIQSGEEQMWEYFPCPFCYIEVEVPFLCNHLQEEHCFDFKNAVCPMCADNTGKDMVSHFTIHHSQQLKRRKSHRTSSANENSYQNENENESYDDASSYHEIEPNELYSAPDPLLSQFVCNFAPVDSNLRKVNHASDVKPVSSHKTRLVSNASQILDKQDLEERIQRIKFVRDMIISTIF